jgi:hypothetical protein
MRFYIRSFIPVLAMLISGCGGTDPSPPGEPGESIPRPLTLALDADALGVGRSTKATIILGNPAPADGAVVALWSSDVPSLAMPVTITIPAGDYTATFTLTNSYGGQRKSVNIMASYQEAWAQTSLFVPSEPPPCKSRACQL